MGSAVVRGPWPGGIRGVNPLYTMFETPEPIGSADVQTFPDAWTCRRRSARSNVKSNGRAEGPLHGLRFEKTNIGFILCHFSQIGTKVGPNLRKE